MSGERGKPTHRRAMSSALIALVVAYSVLGLLAEANPLQAAGLRCKEEANAHSMKPTSPIKAKMFNKRAEAIRIYWINENGARVFYQQLASGGTFTVDTFVRHAWVVTNTQEDCIRIYYPQPYNYELVVED